MTITRKIGLNRGKARLWIEGDCLLQSGWHWKREFIASFEGSALRFIPTDSGPVPAGRKRKVAGTPDRPILDTNTDSLLCLGAPGEFVRIELSPSGILVFPLSREEKAAA